MKQLPVLKLEFKHISTCILSPFNFSRFLLLLLLTTGIFSFPSSHYILQIPNKGRGEAPQPEAVNDFVFEVFKHLNDFPEAYILVHCTHGYNRTGFMIVSYLMRMLSDPTTKVLNAINDFAEVRSPGIYKNYYIKYLFKYYHEKPPSDLPPPSLPPWKAQASPDHGDKGDDEDDGGDDEDDALLADGLFSGAVGRGLQHDDPIGEAVSKSESDWVHTLLMEYILERPDVNPHNCMFPGSQPVSLARSNLGLLFKHRYWVTWKADGTRYLVFIHRMGTYLIDRANVVTRVQMRWPMPLPPRGQGHPPPTAPVGPFHVGTILDGEMVVDEDPKTKICTRRFLAYDMMVINGMKGLDSPWGERWVAIKKYLEHPRRFEQEEAAKGKWKLRYDYAGELFRFRTKEFWPLHMADKVIHKFIPQMVSHEADGLILQPFDDGYIPLTCPELLKWKFAHMNSVDFKARLDKEDKNEQGEPTLKLQLLEPKGTGGRPVIKDLEDAKVYFPPGVSHLGFNGRIIECAWDPERNSWSYMRERKDKTLPNAKSVYESVRRSIEDDIREDELLEQIKEAVKGEVYDEDMGRKQKQQVQS